MYCLLFDYMEWFRGTNLPNLNGLHLHIYNHRTASGVKICCTGSWMVWLRPPGEAFCGEWLERLLEPQLTIYHVFENSLQHQS
jgi:hypothetical protein